MIVSPAADRRFPGTASWIELSASAVRHNLSLFRDVLGPEARLGVVLKGNAYGHGFTELLPIVHELVDVIDVITPQDALAARAFETAEGRDRRQVIVLGPVAAGEAVELGREGVDAVVADTGWAPAGEWLRAAGATLRCHVHIDTGLGREGFTVDEIPTAAEMLRPFRDVLQVVGALSHFSNTEDVTEQEYARSQLASFEDGVAQLNAELGTATLERHFAASAATLVLPASRFDAVRVGIALYGLWPSAETRLSARLVLGEVPPLRPVLSWRCVSQTVKRLRAGSFVGYGCTYRCPQDTRVAVLPVGYFDGYPRLLSGKAHVLVNGQRCAVLGRVMMNHIVVDVTRAAPNDDPIVATLTGDDGAESILADTLASWAQTINYEIVARLGPHLRRIVVH